MCYLVCFNFQNIIFISLFNTTMKRNMNLEKLLLRLNLPVLVQNWKYCKLGYWTLINNQKAAVTILYSIVIIKLLVFKTLWYAEKIQWKNRLLTSVWKHTDNYTTLFNNYQGLFWVLKPTVLSYSQVIAQKTSGKMFFLRHCL